MTVTGVLGGRWRATVTPWGAVDPWDGSPRLDWAVAADDRWHRPEHEAAVRQVRLDGTPVVETRVRIPDGDAVQRVWSVPDGGGVTVVEVENRSPLPIAVAFTRPDLRTSRPPTDVPLQGIDLPTGSVVLPLGHHTTVAVALAHDGSGAGGLPVGAASADSVVRGWLATANRALRVALPDTMVVDDVVGSICAATLCGPGDPHDDPVGFVLGVGVLARLGEAVDAWLPDVAGAAERLSRSAAIEAVWALDAAAVVFAAAGERRALADLARARAAGGVGDGAARWADVVTAEGVRRVAALEHVVAVHGGTMFPVGMPDGWVGAGVEVHGVPVSPTARLSVALRWHGARPAVLWEVQGGEVTLSAPVLAPGWSAHAPSGEALWPAPAAGSLSPDGSFS